jgi:hypothetical protein
MGIYGKSTDFEQSLRPNTGRPQGNDEANAEFYLNWGQLLTQTDEEGITTEVFASAIGKALDSIRPKPAGQNSSDNWKEIADVANSWLDAYREMAATLEPGAGVIVHRFPIPTEDGEMVLAVELRRKGTQEATKPANSANTKQRIQSLLSASIKAPIAAE